MNFYRQIEALLLKFLVESVEEVEVVVTGPKAWDFYIDSAIQPKNCLGSGTGLLGLDWIASASVPKVGCQLDSVWVEHSRPRSASPPSQPLVFPGLRYWLC